MKWYIVEYQLLGNGDRWVSVGKFHARSHAGAIAQFMKDMKLFPGSNPVGPTI